MEWNWVMVLVQIRQIVQHKYTILIDDGAVVFEDELPAELNVSVLTHPVSGQRGGWMLMWGHLNGRVEPTTHIKCITPVHSNAHVHGSLLEQVAHQTNCFSGSNANFRFKTNNFFLTKYYIFSKIHSSLQTLWDPLWGSRGDTLTWGDPRLGSRDVGSGGQSSEFCTDNSNTYTQTQCTHTNTHTHTLTLTHTFLGVYTPTVLPSWLWRAIPISARALSLERLKVTGQRWQSQQHVQRPYIVEYALQIVQILTWGDIVSFPDQNHPLCEKGSGDNRAYCPDLWGALLWRHTQRRTCTWSKLPPYPLSWSE